MSVVYFVTCRQLGMVKVGHSKRIRRRLTGIRNGCPLPIALEATMKGGRAEEQALHARFGAYRVRGEWFEINDEIEALIAAHSTNAGAPKELWRTPRSGERTLVGRVRIKHRLTQRELARILGVAKMTVSSYENGRRLPALIEETLLGMESGCLIAEIETGV